MNAVSELSKLIACLLSAAIMSACTGAVQPSDEQTYSDSQAVSAEFRTASEIVSDMKIGWNLGNTLDVCAADRDGDGIVNEVPENGKVDETLWGNPMTDKALFEALKAEGINAVRIPVTWRDHLGEAPDYKIDEEWLDRVQEVVDYAIDLDMYVIINIHHDGGDDAKFGAWVRTAAEDYDGFAQKYTALWKQICDRFGDYPDRLIFESANEIGFDSLPSDKAYELLGKINSLFTETVRASGKNNGSRALLIAGYWTDIAKTCDPRFTLPEDDNIILSVHYYTPWEFCITNKQKTWGTDSDIKLLKDKMYLLKKNFVDKGVPVIIGEYGFCIQNSEESCLKFAKTVSETCYDMGIRTFLWDNGEVFDRENHKWRVEGLGEALRESVE
ncbi:glycoside hydrolase family 5 protein [Huintestinicola sp.]|uniref:glycoside hydrolase family 5 protein n=1 Tax=Huintestinicola sp. TaxID=2981661 RepID=UPI003D7EE0C7